MKNKKGVSPLLGAVLLIAFSIVLAAIVSNFVIKKTKEFKPDVIAEESVYCDSVNLGYKLSENYGTETIGEVNLIKGIILVNKGTFSIHQLILNTPGLQPIQIKLNPIMLPQPPENTYNIKLQIGSNPEVKIIPIIKDSDTGNLVKCTDKQLTLNFLGLSGGNVAALQEYIKSGTLSINNQELIADADDEDGDGLPNLQEVFLKT